MTRTLNLYHGPTTVDDADAELLARRVPVDHPDRVALAAGLSLALRDRYNFYRRAVRATHDIGERKQALSLAYKFRDKAAYWHRVASDGYMPLSKAGLQVLAGVKSA